MKQVRVIEMDSPNVTTVVDLSKYKDESAVAGLLIGAAQVHDVPYYWGHKSLRFTFNKSNGAHTEMRMALEAKGARTYSA